MTATPTRRPAARTAPVADLSERAQAARVARRRHRLRNTGRIVLAAVPVAGLAWVLLASSWLAVDRIEVVGEARVTAAQVEQAAAVANGTPLATVDTDAVQARLSRLPAIASTRVTRSWPGTLRVALTERVPAAGIVTTGEVRLVDAAGVVFATERALPTGVVRLQVSSPGPRDAATLASLQVLRDLPSVLRDRIRIVRAATPTQVVLLTADGKQVVWGSPGTLAETFDKAAAAVALLRLPGSVVDVSAPGLAVRR